LYFQLEHWVAQGVRSFVFLLHYQSELISFYVLSLSDNLLKNCEVKFVYEPFLMGTGGSVANALRELKIDGEFLITNADTWVSFGIISIFESGSPLIGVVRVNDAGRYGAVEFDSHGRVKNFSEKDNIHSQHGWINSGISKLNSHLFEKWVESI
jgi:NDP-sugar pyrophosphorylase family protein